jgi:hypothetical protein
MMMLTDAMAAQIKAMLLDQIAQLTKGMANKENSPKGGGSSASGSCGGKRDKG